ncbi:MAG: hypothetical protein AAF682_25005 [Planctomycetota bacterium]
MKRLARGVYAALCPLALFLCQATPAAQASQVLENDLARFTFVAPAGTANLNLKEALLKSGSSGPITFQDIAPWKVRLRIDPRDPNNEAYNLDVEADQLSLPAVTTGFVPGANPAQVLTMRWGPEELPPASGVSPPGPVLEVIARWTLRDDSETLLASYEAHITNPGQTTYRLWNHWFPRLAIDPLDGVDGDDSNGSDRLLLGRRGAVFGDPVDYVDPDRRSHFRFTADSDHSIASFLSIDSVGPGGAYSVPLSAYYDDVDGRGLYLACDDLDGYGKGYYWDVIEEDCGPGVPPCDGIGLLFQLLHLTDGNIYDACSYVAPYKLHIAPFQGDWITAAHRYRDEIYTDPILNPRYSGPIGAMTNTTVSDAVKNVPLTGILTNGETTAATGGLCSDTIDLLPMIKRVIFWRSHFGVPIPFLLVNRFAVVPPLEVSKAGVYAPDLLTQTLRQVLATAEFDGFGLAMLGLTEKLGTLPGGIGGVCDLLPSCPAVGGCPMAPYCDQVDCGATGVTQLNLDNQQAVAPVTNPDPANFGGTYCPVGDPADPWAPWWTDLTVSVAKELPATAGAGWVSPGPSWDYCFREDHGHPPGAGRFLSDGWRSIAQDVSQAMMGPFPILWETAAIAFSDWSPIQNEWAFNAGDPAHLVVENSSDLAWYDAPIWMVPLAQMTAGGSLRYTSNYAPMTCDLAYTLTSAHPADSDAILQTFPALSGALQCWNMAQRVTEWQGSIYLNNVYMPDPDLLLATGTDPGLNAYSDMFDYYACLFDLLTDASFVPGGVAERVIEYHTGVMERSPALTLDDEVTETFVLDADDLAVIGNGKPEPEKVTLASYLPLFGVGGVGSTVSLDIDLSSYRPLYSRAFIHPTHGPTVFPISSTIEPHWLPHGTYRHPDGDRVAVLVTNPWGVRHFEGGVDVGCMNPFEFDFPNATPSPTDYAFSFTFDPADYFDGTGFEYAQVVLASSGTTASSDWQTPTGATQMLQLTLQPFESAVFFFREI